MKAQRHPLLPRAARIGLIAFAAAQALLVASAAHAVGSSPAVVEAAADPDFKPGVQAVKAQAWPEVVRRMSAVVQRDARNADAFNYLGFAYRHLGELDKSFAHYERALQIDPEHKGAREYLGEAYLLAGRPADAEAQLQALKRLCRGGCEEARELAAKLAQYRKAHPG